VPSEAATVLLHTFSFGMSQPLSCGLMEPPIMETGASSNYWKLAIYHAQSVDIEDWTAKVPSPKSGDPVQSESNKKVRVPFSEKQL
jgi:hypothetical protein